MTTAVFPAAGASTRMNNFGGTNKNLLKLAGEMVLLRSVKTFSQVERVNFLIVVVSACEVETVENLLRLSTRLNNSAEPLPQFPQKTRLKSSVRTVLFAIRRRAENLSQCRRRKVSNAIFYCALTKKLAKTISSARTIQAWSNGSACELKSSPVNTAI